MTYLSYILILVVISLVLAYVPKRTVTEEKEGFTMMSMSQSYVTLGRSCLLVFSIIYIVFLLDTIFDFSWTTNTQTGMNALISHIEFFIAMGLSIGFIYYGKYKIWYNDTKIIFQGISGKIIEMNWADVLKVTFSQSASQFYIYDNDHKIYVHTYLSGLDTFIHMMMSKVDKRFLTEIATVVTDSQSQA